MLIPAFFILGFFHFEFHRCSSLSLFRASNFLDPTCRREHLECSASDFPTNSKMPIPPGTLLLYWFFHGWPEFARSSAYYQAFRLILVLLRSLVKFHRLCPFWACHRQMYDSCSFPESHSCVILYLALAFDFCVSHFCLWLILASLWLYSSLCEVHLICDMVMAR